MSDKFSFGRIEKTRPHLLADTAELALVYGGFSQIAEGDLLTIIKQSPEAAKELLDLEEPDVDDDGQPDDLGGAEISARQQSYIENCYRQLEFRVNAFGSVYPFELKKNILYLKSELSEENFLYILLLCCSRTRSFGGKVTQKLADEFEVACAKAFQRMVSPDAEIIMFGPKARKKSSDWSSNLIEAIPQLAKKMGCQLAHNWNKNLNPQGDGKIDLVAVYPFDPYSEGYHVILGQCASMEDEHAWQKKRQEAASYTLRGFFHALVEAQAALFIPACFRAENGSWVDDNDVSGVIVIDRLRLVGMLKGQVSAEFAPKAMLDRSFGREREAA